MTQKVVRGRLLGVNGCHRCQLLLLVVKMRQRHVIAVQVMIVIMMMLMIAVTVEKQMSQIGAVRQVVVMMIIRIHMWHTVCIIVADQVLDNIPRIKAQVFFMELMAFITAAVAAAVVLDLTIQMITTVTQCD